MGRQGREERRRRRRRVSSRLQQHLLSQHPQYLPPARRPDVESYPRCLNVGSPASWIRKQVLWSGVHPLWTTLESWAQLAWGHHESYSMLYVTSTFLLVPHIVSIAVILIQRHISHIQSTRREIHHSIYTERVHDSTSTSENSNQRPRRKPDESNRRHAKIHVPAVSIPSFRVLGTNVRLI